MRIVLDEAVKRTFTPSDSNPPLPNIVECHNRSLIPPHAFSEFLKTSIGLEALLTEIPNLLALSQSSNLLDRRAALFALGHFASAPQTSSFVDSFKIVKQMFLFGPSIESYLLRGSLFNALSLILITPNIADELFELGLTVFQFGSQNCIIPHNHNSMVVRSPPRIFLRPEILGRSSELSRKVTELLNPLTQDLAKAELTSFSNEHFASSDNSVFIHKFVMSYHIDYETAEFLIVKFGMKALIPADESRLDFRKEAETFTRIYEAILLGQQEKSTFSRLPIPVLRISEVGKNRPRSSTPEVYLSDEEFVKVTGVDKNTFYDKCTENEKREVRDLIMKS
jgi:hypothetical protein